MTRYQKRKESGKCSSCAGLAVRGTSCCESCLEKQKLYHRTYRANKKANGLCQRSGCNNSVNGKYFCPSCAEKHKLRRHNLRGTTITKEQYVKMLTDQNGVCAISGLSPKDGTLLQIDHNHITGKTRQLLHREINKALGLFKDNPEWLRKAADYIEYYSR